MVFFNEAKTKEWYTVQSREPANENVQGNPSSGPRDRRGSIPGVTGLKYQGVRLESESKTSVGRCQTGQYKH